MFSDPLHCWFAYVGMGAVLLLTIVYMPDPGRLVLGRVLPPNWMSVVHAPIGWIGYFWCYLHEHYFIALMMLCLSGGLDLADGRVARAYDRRFGKAPRSLKFWTQMNHRGTTPLGESLDPLFDKLTVGPIFLHVCWTFCLKAEVIRNDGILWLLYLGACLIVLMLLVDLCGQLLRLDCFERWRQKKKDKRAARVGKYKTLMQWLWLLFYPIWERGWLPEAVVYYLVFLNVVLVAALVLASLSVISKMRPFREVWT